MSHISTISTDGLEFKLETIQELCRRMGWQLVNKKKFFWFGRDGGDCEMAISIPGCQYELGLVRGKQHYNVLADFWRAGGLGNVLGEHGEVFKQLYLQTDDIMWAEENNYQWEEAVSEEAGAKKLVVYLDDFGGGDSWKGGDEW